MIFGLFSLTFTLIRVLLSLVGIFAGLIVVGGLVAGQQVDGWTGLFLVTTILTSVTGVGFPFACSFGWGRRRPSDSGRSR